MLELLLFWGWGVGGIHPRNGTGFFMILLFEKHIFQLIFYSWVFVGRSGGGCVFEHPPNVRTRFIAFALWGVGGNALVGWPCVSKGRISRSADRKAINNLVGGLSPNKHRFLERWGRLSGVG